MASPRTGRGGEEILGPPFSAMVHEDPWVLSVFKLLAVVDHEDIGTNSGNMATCDLARRYVTGAQATTATDVAFAG